MKKLAIAFAFLMSCGLGMAQDVDSTMSDEAVDSTATVATEEVVETMAAPAVDPNEVALKARKDARARKEMIAKERDEMILSWRVWTIIILVLGGAIQGGVAYAGYLNSLAKAKPEIYHVYPTPAKGVTNMQVAVPENTFAASLILKDKSGNEVFNKKIDNSAGNIKVDFSDVAAGTYKMNLVGEKGASKTMELTVV